MYACPLCVADPDNGQMQVKLFDESTLTANDPAPKLTAEDVPLASFGGRPLVLTCKQCNDRMGHTIDAAARRRENRTDALTGRIASRPVRVTAGEHSITADLETDPQTATITIKGWKKEHQPPHAPERFGNYLNRIRLNGSNVNLGLDFFRDRHDDRHAAVSWLKVGYLAMFAMEGYFWAFSQELTGVRKQIQDPGGRHVEDFVVGLHDNLPWSDRHVLFITAPAAFEGKAIQVGRYLVFLPSPENPDIYERISQFRRGGDSSIRFSWNSLPWPKIPTFGQVALRTDE